MSTLVMPASVSSATRAQALWQLLTLPWCAHDAEKRWFMLAILALGGVVAAVLPCLFPAGNTAVVLVTVMGVLDGAFWVWFLPASVRLIRTARTLRTPRAARRVHLSLLAYAGIGCVLPGILLGPATGSPMLPGVALLGISALAFLYVLLPSALTIPGCLLFGSASVWASDLPAAWAWPEPHEPGFLPMLAGVVAGLLLLAVACWARLCAHPPAATYLRRSLVDQVLHNAARKRHTPGRNTEAERARQRGSWLQPEPVLEGVGPDDPRRSLRVALGSNWAPYTIRYRMLRLLASLIWLPLVVGYWWVLVDHDARLRHVLQTALPVLVAVFAMFAAAIGTFGSVQTLRQRWSLAHAEVSLLALLPGLGGPARIKQDLLGLCAGRLLRVWAWVLIPAWAAISWAQGGVDAVTTVSMTGIGMAMAVLAITALLGVFGGIRLNMLQKVGLNAYLCCLALVTAGAALAVHLHWRHADAPGIAWVTVYWCLLQVPLLLMLRGAWRRWRRLPHPFLVRS